MGVRLGGDGGPRDHVAIDVVSRFLPARWKVLHGFFIRVVVTATSVMLILQGLDYSSRIMQVAPATQWSLKYLVVAASVGGALNLVYLLLPRAGPARSGVATVLGGVLLYYAVRHGAGMLYGSSASAVALMIIGLGLIFLEVPIALRPTSARSSGPSSPSSQPSSSSAHSSYTTYTTRHCPSVRSKCSGRKARVLPNPNHMRRI